jgi:hypothetical protein
MAIKLTRRQLLQLAAFSLGGLAMRPPGTIGQDSETNPILVRVATHSLSVYSQPWDKSRIVYQLPRDTIANAYYEVVSDYGPGFNPLWYRIWGGYIHSALTFRVKYELNPIIYNIPETGQVFEVTVPFHTAMRYTKWEGWQPIYRLYYASNQWVMGLDEGPDGEPWYRIQDELLKKVQYHVPAQFLRAIPPETFQPLSLDIPPQDKRIEISIGYQTLTAYEGDTVILQTKITSGKPDKSIDPEAIPTDTPKGTFNIVSKMPVKHMGNGQITADIEAYELPGVPWVCFFEPNTGVALHGTYWHNHFGIPGSHGCVNLQNKDALFLYRWTTPIAGPNDWDKTGLGTRVIVT